MPTRVIIESFTTSPTGLPKDTFTNTWHFRDDTTPAIADAAITAAEKVVDFFQAPPAGFVNPVMRYLAPSLGDTITLIAYDFAAPTPRPELGRVTFTYIPTSASAVPEEVALCLSYYATRNIPKQRGRVYIGPFNTTALSGGTPSRQNADLLGSMAAGGTRLLIPGHPALAPTVTSDTIGGAILTTGVWCVYSRVLGTFETLTDGWVDNRWDSQRRRQVESSARSTF
jgi:hypothetical protein